MSDERTNWARYAERLYGPHANLALKQLENQGGEQSTSNVKQSGQPELPGDHDEGSEPTLHDLQLEELDAFLEYERTGLLPDEPSQGYHLRWLFTMLMFHDIMKLVQPEGSKTSQETSGEDALRLFRDTKGEARVPEALTAKRFSELSLIGSKLSQICDEFGNGCFFFAGDYLTPDW